MFKKGQLIVCLKDFEPINSHGKWVGDIVKDLPLKDRVYKFDGYKYDSSIHLFEFQFRSEEGERIGFNSAWFRPLSEVSEELTEELLNKLNKEIYQFA